MVTLLAVLLVTWVSVASGQSCNPPFVSVGGQCLYMQLGSGLTWQEASEFCTTLAGDLSGNIHLATFPTCDSFDAFSRYLQFHYGATGEVWVGARSVFTPNMWFWESGDALQTGVPFWTYLETYDDGEDCAAADGAYYYRLKPAQCNALKGFVCSDSASRTHKEVPEVDTEKRDACPHDSILIGDTCYVFKHEEHRWDEAERKCGEEHEHNGGMLFYPDNCEEYTRVAHHLQTLEEVHSYWVGAIDVTGDEDWTWVDGGLVPGGPPFWAVGEPSHSHDNQPREHCAIMSSDKDYYLTDTHCTDRYRTICKLTVL